MASGDELAVLTAASEQLLRSVLSCPVLKTHGPGHSGGRFEATSGSTIEHCIKREERLREQLLQLRAHADRTKSSDAADSAKEDDKDLLDIQQELATLSAERLHEWLAIDRVNKSILTAQAVYSDDPKYDEIRQNVSRRDNLVRDVLRLQQELSASKEHCLETELEFRRIRQETRQLFDELHDLQQTEPAGVNEKIKTALQEEQNKNVVLRNVFQMLIVASGINWAQDEHLCDTMLRLGTADTEEGEEA